MAFPIASLLARPKVQVGLVVTSLVILALWAFSQVYIPPASRACLDLYRHAKTAADTLKVDGTIPGSPEAQTPEARTCGSIRQFARWF